MTGLEVLIIKGIAAFLQGAVVGAAIGVAVIILIEITIAVLESWFDRYKESNNVDYDDVGFMINEGIKDGQYKAVQGVFNKGSGRVKDARRIASKQMDAELKNDKVIIFD